MKDYWIHKEKPSAADGAGLGMALGFLIATILWALL